MRYFQDFRKPVTGVPLSWLLEAVLGGCGGGHLSKFLQVKESVQVLLAWPDRGHRSVITGPCMLIRGVTDQSLPVPSMNRKRVELVVAFYLQPGSVAVGVT